MNKTELDLFIEKLEQGDEHFLNSLKNEYDNFVKLNYPDFYNESMSSVRQSMEKYLEQEPLWFSFDKKTDGSKNLERKIASNANMKIKATTKNESLIKTVSNNYMKPIAAFAAA